MMTNEAEDISQLQVREIIGNGNIADSDKPVADHRLANIDARNPDAVTMTNISARDALRFP